VEQQQPISSGGGRAALNYLVIAGVFLVAGLLIGTLTLGRGGGLTRADVEEVVRAVVQEELVASVALNSGSTDTVSRDELREIVAEAVASMDTADSQNAAIADDDPFLGNPDASIVIVEFSDFNCGFCTRFAQDTLPQILENYGDDIKFVYRDMPILTETSAPAAQASQCAAEQDAFWEFHDLMFADSSARNRDAYIQFATDNSLDVAQFTECIDTNKYSGEVTLDLIDGQSLGVRGTPAFFVNGRFISGAQPYEIFSTVIEAELAKSAPADTATGG
jgi:protein-disulfide isomerase